MRCDSPYFWDSESRSCKTCPDTFVYDSDTGKCVCPTNTPYIQDGRCRSCNAPHFWNSELNQCVTCPGNLVYDADNHKCTCPVDYPHYNG